MRWFVLIVFYLLITVTSAQAFWFGSNTANPACPYGNSGVDGCGVSAGLYYAPAVNATTQPTTAQWGTFARQSGQSWVSDYAQTINAAGVIFGVGPNALVASLTDIASYNGSGGPATTRCSYQAATGAVATFTGTVSGSTLTTSNATGSPIAIGMELQTGPSGVALNTYIIGGSGTSWTINTTGSYGPETISAADTYQVAGWPAGDATFVCSGASFSSAVSVTGWNFGPTAYQGAAVGTHDCVNFIVVPTNGTTYTPTITISGNAFINGPNCAPYISGVRYGMISAMASPTRASLIVTNNYVNGRADDAGQCCIPVGNSGNQGFFISTLGFEGNLTQEFNYAIDMPTSVDALTFATGNEAAFSCSNGQASPYNNPGYSFIHKFNYYDAGNKLYGSGHYEAVTMSATGTICDIIDDYNTIVWSSSSVAESTSAFFFFSTNAGTLEHGEVKLNTLVTNLIGGKQYPDIYDFVNYHTSNANPNLIVYDGVGSSCTNLAWACGGFVVGQNLNGTSVIGTQNNVSGSTWNGGCNAGTTSLCPNAGNFPALAANVSETGTNIVANNRVVSETGAEADHGSNVFDTSRTAGANGSTGSPTVTVSACPTNAAGSQLSDTTASQAVGTVLSCSGTTVTLFSNASFAVTSGDALQFAAFGYGVLVWGPNWIDGGASGEASNSIPNYWSANPAIVSGGYQSGGGGGCAVAVTISGNIELRGTPSYSSEAVSSATYTSATGILSMTFAVAPLGASPPSSALGTFVTTSGFTTSAGSASVVNGVFNIVSFSGAGTVMNVQAVSGQGTVTINSATGTLAAGGGSSSYPQVNQFTSHSGGC